MNKYLKLLIALDLLILLVCSIMTPLWSIYSFRIGGDLRTGGIAIAIFSIGGAIFTLIFSFLEGHYKCHRLAMIIAAALLCVGTAGYFFVEQIWELFVVQSILAITVGLQSPAYSHIFDSFIEEGKAGAAWGVWDSCNAFSLGFAALIGSFVGHHLGFLAVFACMFGLSVIALIYTFWVMYKVKQLHHSKKVRNIQV